MRWGAPPGARKNARKTPPMNRTPPRHWPMGLALLALASEVPSSAFAQLADTAWPMHQHDPQHTGRSQFNGPQGPTPMDPMAVPTVLWAVRQSGDRKTAPSVGDAGAIFLGTGRTPLTKIDPNDGMPIWVPDESGGQTESHPAID